MRARSLPPAHGILERRDKMTEKISIERAIEILDPEHRERYENIAPVNEACRMGMDALKRRLPKNPINEKHYYMCPCCHSDLGVSSDDVFIYELPTPQYCGNCGQALSWPSAEDEKSTIVYCKYCQYWHGKAVPNVLAACTFKSNNIHTVYTKAHDTCAFGVNAMESKKTADK